MAPEGLLLELLLPLWLLEWSEAAKSSYSPYSSQARLYSEEGHLFIVGGIHSNITLKTNGDGFININNHNLLHITEQAAYSAKYVQNFRQSILPELQSSLTGAPSPQLLTRLRRLEIALSQSNTTKIGGSEADSRRLRLLTRRVNMLTRTVRALRLLLLKDECESGPCQNGGNCQDLFDGFHCRCTPQWEGEMCERDVDECSRFAGTGLGCQNGGTCRNLAGSYTCACPAGWFGLHCTQRTYDCSLQSSVELCGHGVCINQGGTGRGFVCICDQGWLRREGDGSCTLDKDECAGPHSPCSHDPPVACINTAGSFQCSPCPAGFTGNGYQCADIDECQINNGGCSSSPMVQCINTRGSRVCGPCPPGYSGDGTICSAAGGRCMVGNGGCHPRARCSDNPRLSYVRCICPPGYIGTGIGPNGCIYQPGVRPNDSSVCYNNPCRFGGTCVPMPSGTYMCLCRLQFTGPNCTITADPCNSSPCKNGGTCERIRHFMLEHYRCICPRGYSGPTCTLQNEGCVGKFWKANGTITYPSNQTLLTTRQLMCAWTIYSPNRTRVINVTISEMRFGIRNLVNCFSSYIEFYDGETLSAPLIGRYCGTVPPLPIVSSHSVIFITARFMYSGSHFSFNWTTVPRQCGGPLNASLHGIISSPGSPGNYPHSAHCVWKLLAPPGKRIRITFFSLDIETHRNCSFDYLEIRNGDSVSGPVLRKFCTSVLPDPLLTSGNEAVIIFHSDSSRSAKGFQISYSPIEGLPGCGGTFTTAHGIITAPVKPGGTEYMVNLNCEWLISLPQRERIRIDIESFNLEINAGCNYDYLMIFDGPSRRSGLVGRWCGKDIVPPFTSTSNEVLVVFKSDATYNEGGFVLKYKAVCGGLWTAPSGIIQSSYYPFAYPGGLSCTYTVQQPLGYAIQLNFIDFDLEDSEDCMYDHAMIYNGVDETYPLIGRFCGSNKPGLIISKHNFLHLVFTTDTTNHRRGFRANYTSIDISCGGILTAKTGIINSPKYPEHYPLNKECTWLISTPVGTMIQLTWLSFNLEKSYNCNRDWVAVYDKNPILAYSGQLGDRYCGNTVPPAMSASSNLMSIVFHTDRSVSAPGFSASYVSADTKNMCGGNFFTVMGQILSPNFPNGYPGKLDCRWSITVPTGQQIELTSEAFSLENSDVNSCKHDYLEVRNGGYENSPLIKRYCGLKVDSNIISMANQIYLRFVSDASVSASGFKFLWDGAIMGCGGVITSPSGSIISPNYPQPYGKNGECSYKIAVSHGSKIQLIIIDLDLEEHSYCALDYVQIFDGDNKKAPKLAKICSENHPPSITSQGNLMYILFRSDTSRQGRGFHFKYATMCNVTVKHGFSGAIESPGFPDIDSVPRECFWKINAPVGNKINITFSHFQLGGPETACENAYLKFYESSSGSTEPSHLLGQFCNTTNKPTQLRSSTNVIYVYFKTTVRNRYGTMFRFEWIVSGCGGILSRQQQGELSSPGYPIEYPHDVTCEWYISVPFGSSISITIDDLQFETSEGCRFDSLEIYGGSDESSPRLAKLCKKLTVEDNSIVTTSGSNAFIRFTTDSTYKAKGFHAKYVALPNSKCGGNFVTEAGLIHSHNYPQNYDPHDDCIYLIKVDSNHRINLTFTDFDVDATDKNCTNGYVKVYDGESEQYPLLKKICGNSLPPSIFSTSNTMFIRHKSDGFATAKGFSALYNPDCGANLIINNTGTLIFSEMNTTIEWTYGSKCKWIIQSTKPNSKITVQFVLLDVPISYIAYDDLTNTSSQLRQGVNIFSGDDTDAPYYGHYSQTRLPPAFTVPSSAITVVYVATDTNMGRFTLDYSVQDTSCGGSLNGEGGLISTPNNPDPYPNNVECVWILNAAPGCNMLFEFTKFDLQQSNSCNDDYVEIRQKSESGTLIGVFCGTTLPRRIQTNATIWLKFRSGPEGTAGGFTASYSLGLESQLEGVMGKLGSPLYPLISYSSSTYSWRITVKPGHIIRIAFTDFYIESYGGSSGEDCFNKLQIFDGFDDSAPILKEICGLNRPNPFHSGSNVVYITLIQILNSASRFLLDWLQVEKVTPLESSVSAGNDCKSIIELAKGRNGSYTFTSPGYPNGYKDNLNCEWIFQAPIGDHVRLTFSDIHLEASPGCLSDSITIFNGGIVGSEKEWSEVKKICRHNDSSEVYHGTRLVKVVFTSDFSVNRTGFKGKAEANCGGELTGPNGVLSEGPYSVCQWNITVKPSRTIKVSFTKFIIRGSLPCAGGNFITFRDGGRADSPLLGVGKYCGTSLKDINVPETTSNRLYIYFHNENSEGMVMKFEERSISCGGDIMLSKSWMSETISSPNYPNIPPPHTECVWRAFAPSGESLNFDLTDRFDMTPSRGCTKEYLELRDGSTEDSQLIGRYCSRTPNFVVTEGNALYVKYFTDTNDPKDGFRGTVSLSKCGGSLYDVTSGSILSPGYPQGYDSNLNCTWRLVTSEYKRFRLNITVFMGWSNPAGNVCGASVDRVTVAEVMKNEKMLLTGPEKMTICGIRKMIIESETSEILINFISNKQPVRNNNRYFIIKYSTKFLSCGSDLNLPSGIIKSLGYPISTMGHCVWKITAPEGRRVTVNLVDFDLEKSVRYYTPQRLSIFNGFMNQNVIATLTGDMPEKKVYKSSGNKLSLFYTSAISGNSHRGFIVNYTSLEPAVCGGKIDAIKNGFLSMILKEDTDYYCEWTYINKSPLKDSTITFTYSGSTSELVKEYYPNCDYNLFIAFRGDSSRLHGASCPETKANEPFIVSIPNKDSFVKMMKPLRMRQNVSFSLSWKIDWCGDVLEDIYEEYIKYPSEGTYLPQMDCVWSISVPEGSVIKIRFETFDLETDCTHDYLKIFNGNSPRSPLMSHHCGNIVPADIITQSNKVWLLFHSDEAVQKTGFKLKLSQVDSGCGGVQHGIHGLIQSPDYPSNYKNNIECDWEVRVDTGKHIGLVFDGRFFIEESSGCQHDYLEVSDYVNGQWKLLSRICGREMPKPINSTSNRLRVFFKTNNNIRGDGFKVIWNANCGGVINVLGPGNIYSPGWPISYGNDLECKYILSAPKKVITAKFESFSLERAVSEGCIFDKLQIWIKKDDDLNLENNGIYCDSNKPPEQTSISEMVIDFSTDSYKTHQGFNLAYDIETCGGEVTEETVIASPKTKDMATGKKCTWNITAPSDRIIILKLANLRLSSFPNCTIENIEVWDTFKQTINSTGTLLARVCGSSNSFPILRSSGNKMKINFIANYYTRLKGFYATVEFAYGEKVGCGGTYSLAGSKTDNVKTITNPDINNDGKYDDDMDCHWVVSTPTDSSLMVNFLKMDLKPCQGNLSKVQCCDALEVYDGPSEKNELIGRYCGTDIPRALTSSANYLSFRFKSDSSDTAGGFKINVSPHTSICGTTLLIAKDTPQFLTSPNYPENYPINSHCRWLVTGEKWRTLSLHFLELDVEETSECSGDRIEIFDENETPWKFIAGNNDTHRHTFVGKYLISMTEPEPTTKNIFCGKGVPLNYYSRSNRVMVRFISDSQKTSKGFKIQYNYATCNRNYTAPYGRINLNKIKNNCSFSITAMPNRTISMYFYAISIPMDYDTERCLNKLEVFEGTKKISEICGWVVAPPVYSESNVVTLKVTTVRLTTGFDISYTTTDKGRGCGGSFYNNNGAFTSPMYPGNFRNFSYCCWEVTVPLPGVPSLNFYEFDLGSRSTCDSDYLELYDVTNSGEKIRRTTYCGEDKPAIFQGSGQTVALCYMTSVHNGGLGWSVRWSSVLNVKGEEAARIAAQSG